jgi:DNA-binding LytR/AlgR family response regulator
LTECEVENEIVSEDSRFVTVADKLDTCEQRLGTGMAFNRCRRQWWRPTVVTIG